VSERPSIVEKIDSTTTSERSWSLLVGTKANFFETITAKVESSTVVIIVVINVFVTGMDPIVNIFSANNVTSI
jgi:hypothetical protein